ncbi:unnamed protein product [Medioppia subpectinata]|uniref:Uncharacterized protein n=1 Tax=Medioppia subpectinata TaxID=1979941 RepID=A0A7R9KW11_9ACAR|nr:unnamed protein product [Medioppia subpectinata]CAG2110743.1 unnamed protein product [Medioppia subpectinata]
MQSGSSSWNFAHLLQIRSANRPERYDYGDPDINLARHESPEPPPYDLSAINSTHVALIYTANDWLNQLDDVRRLKEHLKVKLLDDYQVLDETWNHMELVWALGTGQLVNPRVLDILNKAHDDKNANDNT